MTSRVDVENAHELCRHHFGITLEADSLASSLLAWGSPPLASLAVWAGVSCVSFMAARAA